MHREREREMAKRTKHDATEDEDITSKILMGSCPLKNIAYVCIYIYMCVCVCTCIYIYTYIYIYIYFVCQRHNIYIVIWTCVGVCDCISE